MQVLWDIIFGSISFIFYIPTYLIILNIYAICRIDDISWGTKGLDADSSRNSPWKNSWRLIKFICVGKYLLWNIGIGLLLINVGDEYETRFFITITMFGIVTGLVGVKIIIGCLYMIKYKLSMIKCRNLFKKNEINNITIEKSRIRDLLANYSQSIVKEIEENIISINC